ncbi:hypothetical protein SAMN06265173_1328 [Thalassovita litoralis]|uniref:Uncharacterized protein n=1 Tax=Thalassovita litoralis TaxID=1010611 RepID=A0A521FJH2_9RHOB|nr:hypothetical protein [Thalassovita litoralis]SMO96347.1 hypothetical protein SAMN06265173_1328 [Thalassovita litoralis]
MDKREVDKSVLRALIQKIPSRVDTRDWHKKYIGCSISFDEAVSKVAYVFATQAQSFAPFGLAENGPGSEFAEAIVEFPRYFSGLGPSPEEVATVIDRASQDYAAFIVLRFLCMITPQGSYEALDDWKRKEYFGLVKQPAKSKGSGRNKYIARDVLIVNQIKGLTNLGFKPTRNRAKKPGGANTSACDVVAKATNKCGKEIMAMDYAAIENIWRKRDQFPCMNYFAEVLIYALRP